MNQSIATTHAPRRYGTTIAIVIVAAAIAVAIGSIVGRGDERQAVAPRVAQAPAANLSTPHCAFDLPNLAATINAMGSDARARTQAQLTPQLSADLESAGQETPAEVYERAIASTPAQAARDLVGPTPDNVTFAHVVSRLSFEDYTAVMNGLAVDQQVALSAAFDPATAAQCP